MKKILAWHWVKNDRTLRDGRPLVIGETLTHKGKLVLCGSGLHGSRRALDALQYAPGSVCCRVELSGKVVEDTNKLVASRRTVLWSVDAESELRAFARWCALRVIHLWDAPEIVRRYLETGDESIRAAAWAAARAAVRDAALAAAAAVVVAAAADAAADAARAAARAAAWAAVRDAARAAATDAAWDEQNGELERRLLALYEDAGEVTP